MLSLPCVSGGRGWRMRIFSSSAASYQPAPAGPPFGALAGCPDYIPAPPRRCNIPLHPKRAPIHVEQRLLLLHIRGLLPPHTDELPQHLHIESRPTWPRHRCRGCRRRVPCALPPAARCDRRCCAAGRPRCRRSWCQASPPRAAPSFPSDPARPAGIAAASGAVNDPDWPWRKRPSGPRSLPSGASPAIPCTACHRRSRAHPGRPGRYPASSAASRYQRLRQFRQNPARFIMSMFCTSVRSRRCSTRRRNAAASSSVRVLSSICGAVMTGLLQPA